MAVGDFVTDVPARFGNDRWKTPGAIARLIRRNDPMFKTANVGSIDRVVRLVIGAVLIALPVVLDSPLWESALARWLLPVAGLVLVATALVRFCPLYRLVGASTCRV